MKLLADKSFLTVRGARQGMLYCFVNLNFWSDTTKYIFAKALQVSGTILLRKQDMKNPQPLVIAS